MEVLLLLAAITGLSVIVPNDDASSNSEDDPETDDPIEPIEDVTVAPLTLLGTEGADTLVGDEGDDIISGDDGSDQLRGRDGDDQVNGDNGSDLILGDAGDDTLSGGAGKDTLGGGEGDDLARGGLGNDVASGGNGADSLYGGVGNDQLFGDARQVGTSSDTDGDDFLDGGAGNDSIYGNGGIDTLIGGDGNDLIRDYDLSRNEGVDNGSFVDGGAGDDDIRVDGGSTITGGSGNDSFYVHADIGIEGVTEITDFVQGEDRLAFDIVLSESDTGSLSIQDMADGTGAEVRMGDMLIAQIAGGQGLTLDDLDVNFIIEQNAGHVSYTGSDADELIVGNHFDNVINGEGGNDSIYAGTGNGYQSNWNNYHGGSDVLNGGAGDDYIVAEGGDYFAYNDGSYPIDVERDLHVDTLNGGEGNDTLIATNGGILTGGADEDVFVVNQNMRYIDNDTYTGENLTPEPIVITDFDPKEDVIVIGNLGDFSGFSGPGSDQVTVAARADGQGSDIMVSGTVIATVIGANDLTFADLSFDRATALL
ncbi:hypothetical protein NBRC116590_10760 [Pelagimonas sp. KU-00592-HH]|uniref:calcium-binding protein n=1 Tax=Pelagimonas sp. KU-00592-HH TaxID=3127651 RepID=UPI0031037D1D